MKWNTGDVRGTLIKVIAEKILSEELFTDNSTARQALVDALNELKFGTQVSEFETEDFTTLQIYYKSEDLAADFDRGIDVAIVPSAVTATPAQKALQKVLSMDWTIPCSILNAEIHHLVEAEFEQLCSHLNLDRGVDVWKNDLDRVNGLQRDTVIVGNIIFKNNGPEGKECGCETCQCQPN